MSSTIPLTRETGVLRSFVPVRCGGHDIAHQSFIDVRGAVGGRLLPGMDPTSPV